MKISSAVALALCVTFAIPAAAQSSAPRRTENVILVVVDGVRWQEVFGGADSLRLAADTAHAPREFWSAILAERRARLLPFLWNVVGTRGQIFGSDSAQVGIRNGLYFSYPGYNEMLSGFPDPRIDSNEHGPNENVTVFEWISRQPGFAGRVAAFGTWGVFRDIFNRQRSGIHIHAGWEPPYPSPRTGADSVLNNLDATTYREWDDNAYDSFTHQVALRYLRERRPRVVFIGYG